MKRREATIALGVATFIVLALLTVFAIELSNTQAKSKRDVEARVHERDVLAVALIDSLFQTVGQQIPQQAKTYGAPVVAARTMDANRGQDAYLALLDTRGRVLAASRGFTPQARANLADSAALALVRSGHPLGVGNVLPYGKTGVINLAVALPTRSGPRILLTGFPPSSLGPLFAGELQRIPGVNGARNYLIDGRRVVLASTNPAVPAGSALNKPSQVSALRHSTGDVNGRYYDQVRVTNSSWRLILSAPDGPLFASVSGFRKWVPWMVFIAFALVALVALLLSRRLLRATDAAVSRANARLEVVNQELAASNAELGRRAGELARSNAELEQFASIASHDLQEPLRKVRTFTEQLTVIEADSLTDKGRDYLRRANAAAERMQTLIEDLLRFSRVGTHGREFARVDLADVCRGVLEDLEHTVERTAAVVHVGELPTVEADPLQMRQLLQNLISNALKFRRDNGTPEIWVDGSAAGGTAVITVRDNGIGFEPQYGGRIFRVFERLHPREAYAGTGIGLAMCRKIAERHGGTIEADSELGAGATFTVTIPLGQHERPIEPLPGAENGAARDEETHVPA